jgi:OmpA-OmpF porin, OOP family
MKSFRLLALAAALILSFAVAAAAAPVCNKKIESFDFVVDYSGSMMMKNAQLKQDKIVVAKNVLTRINAAIPALSYTGGLHTITPNGVILPQGPWDRASMAAGIAKLRSDFQIFGRMTSMGNGLQAYEPFISSMKRDAALILVTDGDNNRGTDVVEVARQLYASQRNLVIHIISLADTKNGENTIKQIGAMNPNTIVVRGEELATSDAAVERFVLSVFCKDEDVIVLRGVHFAFNSYALDGKAMGILNEAATLIKNNPNKRVVLSGWTDFVGSDAYNQKLSQERANSVKNYLVKQGIPASRMTSIGRGKSFKYDNKTDEGRAMNRRTEVSFE